MAHESFEALLSILKLLNFPLERSRCSKVLQARLPAVDNRVLPGDNDG